MYEYCEEHGVATERCGKLVVAASDGELAGLENLHQRGIANGVKGLAILDGSDMREIEPHVVGVRALHVPTAGIVDYTSVTQALANELIALGAEIRYDREVIDLATAPGNVTIVSASGSVAADRVIACAGLWSDRIAHMAGAPRSPLIVPFRGDYYRLRPERRSLVRGLVYPIPDPRFPFLGIHFTRRIDGEVLLGPNAVLALARDGYRRTDVRPSDVAEMLFSRGFRRLATRHWRTGISELWRDLSKRAFLEGLQRYMPDLEMRDLLQGPSGIRAQAVSDNGELLDDFVVDVVGRFVNVRNAPSPAATSALAIASEVVERCLAAE